MHYTIIRPKFTYILFFFICIKGIYSQNVTIKGKAHGSYQGKVIRLLTYTDFITHVTQKEDQDTIQSDGFFILTLHTDHTQPVILKIDNITAQLYVQPDFVYGITLPEVEDDSERKNDAEVFVNPGIIGSDSTELNALIFDYQRLYNNLFLSKDGRFLTRTTLFKRTDSLKIMCDERYKKIKNEYFKNYYHYSIASVNASLSRGESYLINIYILNKPILDKHYEYMQFFGNCFSGYLNVVGSMKKGQSLYNIINVKANYTMLDAFLKDDRYLKSDSLRELIIIKNLWDFYYKAEFSPDAIETIISDLNQKTKIIAHKKITATMLTCFNKMQPGSAAPDFAARSKDGTMGTLNTFKNRWIYLNFFSVSNIESQKEMIKISALKKKYGDKLTFVSICVDDSLKSFTNYLRSNPKYDWNIWYNYDKRIEKTAKENYFVTGTEAYFLINNFGYLAQSPAQAPSKGIEYKLNVIFKVASKNTKTGIR